LDQSKALINCVSIEVISVYRIRSCVVYVGMCGCTNHSGLFYLGCAVASPCLDACISTLEQIAGIASGEKVTSNLLRALCLHPAGSEVSERHHSVSLFPLHT
jgi:hypothetical protein